MAIPVFQSVMPLNEARERAADQFQLTEGERKKRLPSGRQTLVGT